MSDGNLNTVLKIFVHLWIISKVFLISANMSWAFQFFLTRKWFYLTVLRSLEIQKGCDSIKDSTYTWCQNTKNQTSVARFAWLFYNQKIYQKSVYIFFDKLSGCKIIKQNMLGGLILVILTACICTILKLLCIVLFF